MTICVNLLTSPSVLTRLALALHFNFIFYSVHKVDIVKFVYIWQLSMWRCSDELRGRVQQIEASNRKDAKHYMGKDVPTTLCLNFS